MRWSAELSLLRILLPAMFLLPMLLITAWTTTRWLGMSRKKTACRSGGGPEWGFSRTGMGEGASLEMWWPVTNLSATAWEVSLYIHTLARAWDFPRTT